jgi:DNA-binding response OmpR family regulator
VILGVSEPDLGPLLSRLLLEGGYDASLATDGIAVVSTIARVAPALLILDSNLARLDGLLTLEVVRSITRELPVVLLASIVGPALRQTASRLGAVVLRKPFQNYELLEVVERECRAWDKAKEPPSELAAKQGPGGHARPV